MIHDFSEVFDTDSQLWQRVLEIYAKNEKYEKKIVSGRNLHHKFPRSFSKKLGEPIDNDKDNLISLSLADHFLVHYYYYKLAKKGYRQSMATAFTFMAKKSIKYMSPDTAEMIAKDYEEATEEASTRFKDPIRNAKISASCKGRTPYNKGKSMSNEQRNKLSEITKSQWTDEFRKKYHELRTGKTYIRVKEQEPRTIFGNKFKEHYGITRKDNINLYRKEYGFYQRNGYCRWEQSNYCV